MGNEAQTRSGAAGEAQGGSWCPPKAEGSPNPCLGQRRDGGNPGNSEFQDGSERGGQSGLGSSSWWHFGVWDLGFWGAGSAPAASARPVQHPKAEVGTRWAPGGRWELGGDGGGHQVMVLSILGDGGGNLGVVVGTG